ncbi:hypothetical protein F9C07_2823 [Aspergillus flavus]|uniref:Uncharacterized protein n=1 Tax=Aspergillus flavus (strain ATCC 200026 / FGSC A1120 / IAM 13836 / NRRL 3357 / JCM 12722 / SRRC 167) TaxID=332952 RepID=A0A7U2QTH0_ASPFN|nr:hypothetical protein F9C07_2823 [Aspergillus flavus]
MGSGGIVGELRRWRRISSGSVWKEAVERKKSRDDEQESSSGFLVATGRWLTTTNAQSEEAERDNEVRDEKEEETGTVTLRAARGSGI